MLNRALAQYRLPERSEAIGRCGYCVHLERIRFCGIVEGEVAFWATCRRFSPRWLGVNLQRAHRAKGVHQ